MLHKLSTICRWIFIKTHPKWPDDSLLSLSGNLRLSLHSQKQATHPNMRTYYFCSDTAKDMESWMKVMTDAALVHSEPVKRFVGAWLMQPFVQKGCILSEAERIQQRFSLKRRRRHLKRHIRTFQKNKKVWPCLPSCVLFFLCSNFIDRKHFEIFWSS